MLLVLINFFPFFFSHRDYTVIPILVGSLSPDREAHYGKILSKYLSDPSNLFVISSDFCHWGQRFRYTHYDKSCGDIYQSIQRLDQQVRKSPWLKLFFCVDFFL